MISSLFRGASFARFAMKASRLPAMNMWLKALLLLNVPLHLWLYYEGFWNASTVEQGARIPALLALYAPSLLGSFFGRGVVMLNLPTSLAGLPRVREQAGISSASLATVSLLFGGLAGWAASGFTTAEEVPAYAALGATAYVGGLFAPLLILFPFARFVMGVAVLVATFRLSGPVLHWMLVDAWRPVVVAVIAVALQRPALWLCLRRTVYESDSGEEPRSRPVHAPALRPTTRATTATAQLQAAKNHLRSAAGYTSRWKAVFGGLAFGTVPLFLVAMVPTLFGEADSGVTLSDRVYRSVTGDSTATGDLERHRDISYYALVPLFIIGLFATAQHASLGAAKFSRKTLARFAYRAFLGDAALVVGTSVAFLTVLTLIASLAGGRLPSSFLPSYFYTLLWLIPAIPWAVAANLWLQSTGYARARATPSPFSFGPMIGFGVNMMSLLFLAQWAIRYSIDARQDGVPAALALTSLAVLAAGIAVLRLAFSYYYSRVTLIA